MGPVKSKMSRKASNGGVAQTRESETKVEPQKSDDAKTASQSRNDTPLQTPATSDTSPRNPETAAATTRRRTRDETTGGLSVREFMAYHRHQHTRLSMSLSSNVNFTLTDSGEPAPAAVQEVFNTAELLEMILLLLPPGYLYTKAQLTCRGFKTSMESSPTFQRRLTMATTRGAPPDKPLLWSIQPKCMRFQYTLTGRVAFKLTFTDLSFGRHLLCERFRRLAVTCDLPQRIEVLWYGEESELVPEVEPDGTGYWMNLDQMIWMSSEVAVGRQERISFGRIFDAVARRVRRGKRVGGMVVILTEDRHTFCGPAGGGGEERVRSAGRCRCCRAQGVR